MIDELFDVPKKIKIDFENRFLKKGLSDKELVMLIYPYIYDRVININEAVKILDISKNRFVEILKSYNLQKLRKREDGVMFDCDIRQEINSANELKYDISFWNICNANLQR